MRKLRLTLEDLSVESFSTAVRPAREGTVGGHDLSDSTCHQKLCTCDTMAGHTCEGTCDASCNGTCVASCDGTCDGCVSVGGTCGGYTCVSCEGTCNDSYCGPCTYPGQRICA